MGGKAPGYIIPAVLGTLTVLALVRPMEASSIGEADQILGTLVTASGTSSHEQSVRNKVIEILKLTQRDRGRSVVPDPVIDRSGNVLLTLGPKEDRIHALFLAHMDEIGFEIQSILKNGMLVLDKVGGFYPELFMGRVLLIRTPTGPKPVLVTGRNKEGLILAWTGLASAEAVLHAGIRPGMTGTIRKRYDRLGPTKRMGRSMDDRTGCAALLLALRHLDPKRLRHKIVYAWTTGEEIGLKGASDIAAKLQVPIVYGVDTFVSSDSPLESDHFARAVLGGGAVLRAVDHSNITPLAYVEQVLEQAKSAGIPLQFGVTGGGNDGSAFTPYGSLDMPLAWPLRYSHSPVEITDLRDLIALSRLIVSLSESVKTLSLPDEP